MFQMKSANISRRVFGASLVSVASATAWGVNAEKRLRLGIDNFAVRSMGWKAGGLVDYASKLKCDSLFITDLHAFKRFDDKYLMGVKRQADGKGIKLYVGSWSI